MKKQPSLSLHQFDEAVRQNGYNTVAGVDEAGRGPWAGPVVSACVILPRHIVIEGLNDSKALTPKQRELLFPQIQSLAIEFKISIVNHDVIDDKNILQATWIAMRRAIGSLSSNPDIVLVDGFAIPGLALPQRGIIKGDSKSASIAAASILAKVTRDRLMNEIHASYPEYGFDRHKGYGTKLHHERLKMYGPCEVHRRSFAPVRKICNTQSR